MKYYFAGAEIKMWRDLLAEQNVPTVSLSFVGLSRRVKKTDSWQLASNFPENQQIFVDSGAYSFNKENSEYTVDDAIAMANAYETFVAANIDRLSIVSEFDAQILGREVLEARRLDFYHNLKEDKFMPIWHTEYGVADLEDLCSAYTLVGICQSDLRDESLIPIFNSMVNRYGVSLHGVAVTRRKMMEQVNFDSVSSTSWLSPSIYGDTIVWTGQELKRYPKAYKAQARKKHRSIYIDNGFDHNKIEADDSRELLKLSLWSWQQFIASLKSNRVTNLARNENVNSAEMTTGEVDTHGTPIGNNKLLPAVADRRETEMLPIMGVQFVKSEDDEEGEELPFLEKRSDSMRACNSCFLREKCPGAKQDANCLYNIPIQVKTRDQMKALQEALIEMQTQRVLFMQMAEDLEGGYADPNLSSEIDRLQRMIKAKADAEKEGFSLKIEATGSNQGPGVMAKFFGNAASEQMRALDAPVDADIVLKDADIFEADVVE